MIDFETSYRNNELSITCSKDKHLSNNLLKSDYFQWSFNYLIPNSIIIITIPFKSCRNLYILVSEKNFKQLENIQFSENLWLGFETLFKCRESNTLIWVGYPPRLYFMKSRKIIEGTNECIYAFNTICK